MPTLDDLREPVWERQRTVLRESAKMYTMFLIFAEIPPGERSLRAAWEKWKYKAGTTIPPVSTQFRRVGAQYLWQERAAARDIHSLRQRYRMWGDREWRWRDKDYVIADKLRNYAEKALERIIANADINADADGEPGHFKLSTVINMLKTASALQKNSVPVIGGLSTAQISDVLTMLPPNKRERVIALISERRAKIGLDETDMVDGEIRAIE